MAFTYSKLADTAVGAGGTSTITFNNIPQNYTDLNLVLSLRTTTQDSVYISFNGSTSSFTAKFLEGAGTGTPTSGNGTRYVVFPLTVTANTFSSSSVYIPNYAGANNKSYSIDSVSEANQTTAYADLIAGLWSNVSAINQIGISLASGGNLLTQHSTATLYGIRVEL
jgi:hypothetical protein